MRDDAVLRRALPLGRGLGREWNVDFEMWIWRRVMKVSWTEHKNEEVLQMVDAEREMMDTLKSRQKRWLGHILSLSDMIHY